MKWPSLKTQERIFTWNIYLIYLLLFASVFNLGLDHSQEYLQYVLQGVQTYVCLFLLWRFNPFSKVSMFGGFDKKIAFNAGFILLTTNVMYYYL